MASGPEHYREAEAYAELAARQRHSDPLGESSEWSQRQAQVHATLALVGATVNRYDPGWGPDPLDDDTPEG